MDSLQMWHTVGKKLWLLQVSIMIFKLDHVFIYIYMCVCVMTLVKIKYPTRLNAFANGQS